MFKSSNDSIVWCKDDVPKKGNSHKNEIITPLYIYILKYYFLEWGMGELLSLKHHRLSVKRNVA